MSDTPPENFTVPDQITFNLCINAAQAMDGVGRIEIDAEVYEVVSTRRVSLGDLSGRYVCISVSDSGRGMDEATLRRIFEPFFTTRAAGDGLGLATVHEIVRDHGGSIDVRSTAGAGSRFDTWLPLRAPPARISDRCRSDTARRCS
jgi:signal transduction histidine kinase